MENSEASYSELEEELSCLRGEIEARDAAMLPVKGKHTRSWRHRATTAVRYAIAIFLVGTALLATLTLKGSFSADYFRTPFFFCAVVRDRSRKRFCLPGRLLERIG